MHFFVLAADEVERVMIRVAADEDEEIADPIGFPEAEYAGIEVARWGRSPPRPHAQA
jgi:hypothetical protein